MSEKSFKYVDFERDAPTLHRQIVSARLGCPDKTNGELAAVCGCSAETVGAVLNYPAAQNYMALVQNTAMSAMFGALEKLSKEVENAVDGLITLSREGNDRVRLLALCEILDRHPSGQLTKQRRPQKKETVEDFGDGAVKLKQLAAEDAESVKAEVVSEEGVCDANSE